MTDWRPTLPELAVERREDIFDSSQYVIVHFWANWNLHDRKMDAAIQHVRGEFQTIDFFACNIDIPENHLFCNQCEITNIPALSFFANGHLKDTLIGYVPPVQLHQLFAGWLTSRP